MVKYIALANVNEQAFQNPQELMSIWGAMRNDIEELGGELLESHALLGEYDFQITFEVDDEDRAIQIAMAIERHGLDTRTMRAMPVEKLGGLIEDV